MEVTFAFLQIAGSLIVHFHSWCEDMLQRFGDDMSHLFKYSGCYCSGQEGFVVLSIDHHLLDSVLGKTLPSKKKLAVFHYNIHPILI